MAGVGAAARDGEQDSDEREKRAFQGSASLGMVGRDYPAGF